MDRPRGTGRGFGLRRGVRMGVGCSACRDGGVSACGSGGVSRAAGSLRMRLRATSACGVGASARRDVPARGRHPRRFVGGPPSRREASVFHAAAMPGPRRFAGRRRPFRTVMHRRFMRFLNVSTLRMRLRWICPLEQVGFALQAFRVWEALPVAGNACPFRDGTPRCSTGAFHPAFETLPRSCETKTLRESFPLRIKSGVNWREPLFSRCGIANGGPRLRGDDPLGVRRTRRPHFLSADGAQVAPPPRGGPVSPPGSR
jgi:hypothetical protein